MTAMLRLSAEQLAAHMDRLNKSCPVRKIEKLNAQAPVNGGKKAVTDKAAFLKTSEHAEQKAVISWWAIAHKSYGLPEFALYAVPNASKRTPKMASWMKCEGLRKGMLDLSLDAPKGGFSGLRIEMKIKPNSVSQEQAQVINYLAGAGYAVQVCWSATEAIELIKRYLS